jgi:hypothetical protein
LGALTIVLLGVGLVGLWTRVGAEGAAPLWAK